jgi:hypothetical protein
MINIGCNSLLIKNTSEWFCIWTIIPETNIPLFFTRKNYRGLYIKVMEAVYKQNVFKPIMRLIAHGPPIESEDKGKTEGDGAAEEAPGRGDIQEA